MLIAIINAILIQRSMHSVLPIMQAMQKAKEHPEAGILQSFRLFGLAFTGIGHPVRQLTVRLLNVFKIFLNGLGVANTNSFIPVNKKSLART